jgi:hypothetical protein
MKLIAALMLMPLAYVAATEAEDILNTVAPQAATSVSDVSLKSIYGEVFAMVNIEGLTMDEALHRVAEDFTQEGIVYTVEGGELTARTDWSCRRLVVTDHAVVIEECVQ